MGAFGGPNIVKDGLIFAIDAGNSQCWTAESDKAYNLVEANTGSVFNTTSGSLGSNGSWVFDGTDDWIDTPINIDSNPVSLSAWVHIVADDVSGDFNSIVVNDNGGYDRGFGIYRGDKWDIRIGNGRIVTVSASEGWQHACLIYISDNVYFYANGELIYAKGTKAVTSAGSNVNIGRAWYSGGAGSAWWDGLITGIMIYNKELSASEVKRNYNVTKGRFGY